MSGDLKRRMRSVVRRDGSMCWLCGCEVDFTVHYQDHMAASLDHVIPKCRGGTKTIDNLKLAHKICNSSRADKFQDTIPERKHVETRI